MNTFNETFNGEELNIITQAKEYVVLLPTDTKEADDDVNVMILKVHPLDKESKDYISIEDIAILDKKFEEFKEKFKDKFDFNDQLLNKIPCRFIPAGLI